jgi:hypothetical protein
MRDLRLLAAAALFCPAVGCNWMREWREKDSTPRPIGKIEPQPPEKFISLLNWRAKQFQSVEYSDVHVRVTGKDLLVPVSVDGSLAAAQPRNFRMRANGKMAGTIDLGSNPEQFWVYAQAPGDTMFVYASHDDFEKGKARLPGNLPFEPDWVMLALGLAELPSAAAYDVQINDRERTYTVGWSAVSPNGVPVRKEVVIDADPATGKRSQVKRHVLRDAKSKLIATAEIKSAEVFRVGQNAKGEPLVIQYPTHLVLRWENPRFEMDMTLDGAAVNTGLAQNPARQALFIRPTFPNTPAVDLARYDFPTGRPAR